MYVPWLCGSCIYINLFNLVKTCYMKGLLIPACLITCAATAQKPVLPSGIGLQKEWHVKDHMNASVILHPQYADSSILDWKQLLEKTKSFEKKIEYAKEDHMPILVPDITAMISMPNGWKGTSDPDTEPMPNPGHSKK
jgi:hypothetical protein